MKFCTFLFILSFLSFGVGLNTSYLLGWNISLFRSRTGNIPENTRKEIAYSTIKNPLGEYCFTNPMGSIEISCVPDQKELTVEAIITIEEHFDYTKFIEPILCTKNNIFPRIKKNFGNHYCSILYKIKIPTNIPFSCKTTYGNITIHNAIDLNYAKAKAGSIFVDYNKNATFAGEIRTKSGSIKASNIPEGLSCNSIGGDITLEFREETSKAFVETKRGTLTMKNAPKGLVFKRR